MRFFLSPVRYPLAALISAALLVACGGGGSSGDTQAPLAPVALKLSASSAQTLAGGKAVALSVGSDRDTAVSWKLGDGAPGSLSATTGSSVSYTPPKSGLTGPVAVPVSVSGGGGSASLTIMVSPDPGAAGISLIAGGYGNSTADVDGTGAGAGFYTPYLLASDLKGTLYVGTAYFGTPDKRAPLRLRKISPGGVVTTLGNADTWFGKPRGSTNANDLTYINGMLADRAGNLYFSKFPQSGGLIYKLAPDGTLTEFAGAAGQAAAVVDGKGSAARFSEPRLFEIDTDGNLFVFDAKNLMRKVAPDGTVTTVDAPPAWVSADMNGNRYELPVFSTIASGVYQIAPNTSTKTLIAGAAQCTAIQYGPLPACLGLTTAIVPLDGASYALLSNNLVLKLVVAH